MSRVSAFTPRSRIGWLGNLRIKSKILIGFLAVLAILIIVAGTGIMGLSRGSDEFTEFARLSRVTAHVLAMDGDFLRMRLNLRVYIDTGDEKALAAAREMQKRLDEQMATALEIVIHPERRRYITQAAGLYKEYTAGVDRMAEIKQRLTGTVATVMDGLGKDLRAELSDLIDGTLATGSYEAAAQAGLAQQAFLLARLRAARYVGQHDESAPAEVKEALQTLRETLSRIRSMLQNPSHLELVKTVTDQLATYEKGFDGIVVDTAALADVVDNGLVTKGGQIGKLIETTRESAVTAQQELDEAIKANAEEAEILSIVLTVGGLILGLLLTWLIGRGIANPIVGMTGAMTRLAGGDLEIAIPALDKRDEIGAMAKAVQVFKENAIEKRKLDQSASAAGEEIAQLVSAAAAGDLSKRIGTADKTGFFKTLGEGMNILVGAVASAVGEIAGMMAAMAQGDLSKRISGDYQGEFLKLKHDANSTAEKLAEIAGQTVEGMTNIKASTTEIATGATDLSSRTEEQVASLEEIAASVRQLNTTVQQSSENAGQASQLAIAARTAAESGGEVANAAVTAMGEIEQSSQKISEIVGMIDEIAFQTNLLALNAAVEAARAGEAGRGFAVVAGEVRALAQRSSQASKDIKSLILNSSSQVKQGVELVNRAGATLGEIVTSVKRVSDIVAEIAAANKEQSASVGEVQEAIGQIEQATQQNAALVEETTAALGSADNQVQGVTDVISFFRIDAASAVKPANTTAPAKGAKAVQAKLAAKVADKPSVSPTQSSGGKKLAATGTDDGWEEF
jgi:methyl-accepting chemotaxis protein